MEVTGYPFFLHFDGKSKFTDIIQIQRMMNVKKNLTQNAFSYNN
jgi:hypothetical protein